MSTPEHETITLDDPSDFKPGDVFVTYEPRGGFTVRRVRPAPPTPAPGASGWATIDGKRRRGFTVDEKGFVYAIPTQIGTGYMAAHADQWTDFVPDPDTPGVGGAA